MSLDAIDLRRVGRAVAEASRTAEALRKSRPPMYAPEDPDRELAEQVIAELEREGIEIRRKPGG